MTNYRKRITEEEKQNIQKVKRIPAPDGGYAWVILTASFVS